MPRSWWGLFGLGFVWHALWARTMPWPVDMDAQYYLLVARNIADGLGAGTASLWNLSILPEALPLAADLHWMPLPSRVLVPFVVLFGASGAWIPQALLGAAWGPLTAWLARDLGGTDGAALGAGVLAASGSVYVRSLSAPDCYALFGVLGALGLYHVSRGKDVGVLIVALLAGFTRNDGFLLGLALAMGFGGRQRMQVAGAALLAPLLWTLRGWAVAGGDYLAARRLAANTGDYLSVFDGVNHAPLGLLDRASALVAAVPDLVEVLVTPGMLLLTPLTLWVGWEQRERAWVRSFWWAVLAVPVVTVWLAPAVATHGTLFRTSAAMLPAHLALGAVGLSRLGAWSAEARGYSAAFLPGLFAGAYLFIVTGMGLQRAATPMRPSECARVAELPSDAPVFTSRPLEMELLCHRPGVMLTRSTPRDRVARVAERYGVRFVVVSPDGRLDEGSVREQDLTGLLPAGWLVRSEGVWAAPAAP